MEVIVLPVTSILLKAFSASSDINHVSDCSYTAWKIFLTRTNLPLILPYLTFHVFDSQQH